MATRTRRIRDDQGIVRLVGALTRAELPCNVELPWKQTIRVGKEGEAPLCTLVLNSERLLRRPLTELSLANAYVAGDLDIEDLDADKHAAKLFKLRDELRFGTSPARALRLAGQIAFVSPTRANARAIGEHYALPDEFFLSFLDEDFPVYSQCRYRGKGIDLRDAAKAKLKHAWTRVDPEPGARILDIGGGWGALMRYRNSIDADVSITSLTLTEASKRHIVDKKLLKAGDEVLVEDLLDHRRREFYDHVLILGVIEHIPNYARFAQRVWDALKPGGLLYLDASATREKYAGSAFTRRYTWPGPHACLALGDLTEELLFHGFAIREVEDGGDDYRRTMRAWARNLDANEKTIKEQWGDFHYRTWRVFLWGGAAGFETGRLQSYTVVAQRLEEEGPRPGRVRRAAQFAASLR